MKKFQNVKDTKCTNFSRFCATFVKFSKDFMNQNVENVQQRMNSLSSRVARGDKCSYVEQAGNGPSRRHI